MHGGPVSLIGPPIIQVEVVAKGESIGEFREIGSKRVYQSDNCKRRRVSMGLHEYIELTDVIKTELEV